MSGGASGKPDRVLSPAATEPMVSAHSGNAPLRVLSLFAGIGGFDLGFERTGGFRTVAFCEIHKKAQAILLKHWPEVPIYDDVRSLTGERLAADGIAVDVICGGFPCQDVSTAGLGAGINGARSGLWAEFARLIGELRPAFAVVENVANLRFLGLGRVLGDLAALGYDACWHCIPASSVGAPHCRDRIWILATHADARLTRTQQKRKHQWAEEPRGSGARRLGPHLAANGSAGNNAWKAEPCVARMAHGLPAWLDRYEQLGNAVVPQIPELIGRAILAAIAGGTGTDGTAKTGPARRVSTRAVGIAQ